MARKESIEVRPGRPRDRFNDPTGPVPDWRTINGATVVPRSSNEDDSRGPIVISGFMVVVPSLTRDSEGELIPLTSDWEFRIRGEVYQVEGEIADYGRKKITNTMRAS